MINGYFTVYHMILFSTTFEPWRVRHATKHALPPVCSYSMVPYSVTAIAEPEDTKDQAPSVLVWLVGKVPSTSPLSALASLDSQVTAPRTGPKSSETEHDGSVSGTWACRADCPVVQRDVDKYSDQTCFFIRETTGRLRRRHAAVN